LFRVRFARDARARPESLSCKEEIMSTANPRLPSRDDARATNKPSSTVPDATSITRQFMKYARTFQGLDPRAILQHLHVPFVFCDGHDMRVLSSAADVEALLAAITSHLEALGYARSDVEELWAYPLGANVALVSVARARYNAEGDEIDCLGETYTLLRDADDGWRIGMAVVHDAANVLRARPRWRRDSGRVAEPDIDG
jgi:hypothetical protein